MTDTRTHFVTALVLLFVLHLGSAILHAQTTEAVAASVQPFVDRHELAGAVMLVADKDKVLTTEAVGWVDVAAAKPMQDGFDVLDRLAIQADHRHGADDAGG